MTCRTLEEHYHVKASTLEKQYKEKLSGYRQWDQLEHACEWLVFEENMGLRLAIDETALSNGELHTFVTNRDARCRKGSIVAIIEGTRAEDIIRVLERIPEEKRLAVAEVTMDLSESMRKAVRVAFPNALIVPDRFHIQREACEAVQEIRIRHRWEAIELSNKELERCRKEGRRYEPERFSNGDTRRELLARSIHLIFKSPDKWTPTQSQRAQILFREYPDIQKAYSLSHSLRMIFNTAQTPDGARLKLAHWYKDVEESGFKSFATIANTFRERNRDIVNYFLLRSSNAMAESFHSQIKLFRANLRGVADKAFFLFRLANIYA